MSGGIKGYEITRDGRVFSNAHNWRGYGRREMRQIPDQDGYLCVRLTVGEVRKRYRVHRLVAIEHIGPRPSPSHEIRHLDGNKKNNKVENLAWGTAKDNARDRELHGRTSRGIKHSNAIKCGIRKSTNPFWLHARENSNA